MTAVAPPTSARPADTRRRVVVAVLVLGALALVVQSAEHLRLVPPAPVPGAWGLPQVPVPSTATVRPRELAAAAALFLAAVFESLYLYRQRRYIVQWARAWGYLAAAMLVQATTGWARSGQPPPETPSRWAVAVAGMFAIAFAFVLVKAAATLRGEPWSRRQQLWLTALCLVWYILARLTLPPPVGVAGAAAGFAVLLTVAAAQYLRAGRERRLTGATVVGVTLAVMVVINVATALSVPALAASPSLALSMLAANAAGCGLTAIGMCMIVVADAEAELTELASTDPLTGCLNRHHLTQAARAELKRRQRFGTPLSVLFIDLDAFKRVNDTLGHAVGDRVLRHAAGVLRANIRAFDLVCRWGGDEFLVVMACGGADAERKARQLERAFAASLAAAGLPEGLSLSIGAAEIPAGAESIDDAVRSADEQMYAHKLERDR